MKKFLLISLFAFSILSLARESFGDVTPSDMSSTLKSSSKLESLKPLEKPQAKNPPPSQTSLPPMIKTAPPIAQQASYLHPGILVYINGKWEGSDHLLNLPNHIGVYVTLIKPSEESLNISQEKLEKEVENIFGQANLKPVTLAPTGRPPLPAFEIEIFVYPIEKGYTACCEGRLFESVNLDRFVMDSNMAFQAITWEKQTLIVGPKATFDEQLTKTVKDIAEAFVERVQAYERIKRESIH